MVRNDLIAAQPVEDCQLFQTRATMSQSLMHVMDDRQEHAEPTLLSYAQQWSLQMWWGKSCGVAQKDGRDMSRFWVSEPFQKLEKTNRTCFSVWLLK